MLKDTVAALQTVVNETKLEADRLRSQKLLEAVREMDVMISELYIGKVTEEAFKDGMQALVLVAGLVGAETEMALLPAAKAVVLAMRPYETLLNLEHEARMARAIPRRQGDAEATRSALYAAIEGLSLEMLREYGDYRKGAAK